MSNYKVKSNLKYNGKQYAKGDTVDIDGNEADISLRDGIIVDLNATDDDDEDEVIQPPVNNVKREGDDVDGDKTIEAGKVEKPQPGDGQNDDDEANKDNDDAPKSQYKVLQELEYPKGTVHKVDAVLELTDEEAGKFGEGLIEKVEDNL